MATPYDNSSPLRDPLVRWFLGFFGAAAGFILLPKTIKFVIRRFLLGFIGEIFAVVLTGLLADQLLKVLGAEKPQPRPAVRKTNGTPVQNV